VLRTRDASGGILPRRLDGVDSASRLSTSGVRAQGRVFPAGWGPSWAALVPRLAQVSCRPAAVGQPLDELTLVAAIIAI
jgi:hypothetical protein